MNIQEKILQRFCKDYALPITVFQQPYFGHFIEVLDPVLNTHEKLKLLQSALKELGTPDAFMSEGARISKAIITTINETPNFQKFKNMGKDDFTNPGINGVTVYHKDNQGIDFISIDLKKANFNSLQLLGVHDDLKIYQYEDLVGKFTDLEYFKKSKALRQVIFGDESMEPKKQQRLQKHVIYNLSQLLIKAGFDVLGASADEIVLKNCKDIKKVQDVLSAAPQNMQFFRVEHFTIKGLGEKPYFVKTVTDESGETKEEFKAVPSQYFAQAVRLHLGQPLQENDLVFSYEGITSRMLEPVFEELKNNPAKKPSI